MERSLQKSYSKNSGFTRTADKHAIQEQCGVREVRGRFKSFKECLILHKPDRIDCAQFLVKYNSDG